jgi:hypothetical protein
MMMIQVVDAGARLLLVSLLSLVWTAVVISVEPMGSPWFAGEQLASGSGVWQVPQVPVRVVWAALLGTVGTVGAAVLFALSVVEVVVSMPRQPHLMCRTKSHLCVVLLPMTYQQSTPMPEPEGRTSSPLRELAT